jgi:hypothetical protein
MYAGGYNSSSEIDLSKLTPGFTYLTKIYYRTWDHTSAQNITLEFDEDGANQGVHVSSGVINESETYPSVGKYISYQYTATSSPLTIAMVQSDTGASWHFYGLTNEMVSVPEPSTALLTVFGLVSLVAYAWRKRK